MTTLKAYIQKVSSLTIGMLYAFFLLVFFSPKLYLTLFPRLFNPILVSFILLLPFSHFAQILKWEFEVVEMPGGNLSNRVPCIIEDSIGYLWFASHQGLHRYDGHQFKTFLHNPVDSTSLSNNYIEELFVDRKGVLWLGSTLGGLQQYNPESENFISFLYEKPDSSASFEDKISAITEDVSGNLWVGTSQGLLRFDQSRKNIKKYVHDPNNATSLSYNEVADLIIDRQGRLWVCTGWYPSGREKGGLNRYNPQTDSFDRFLHDPSDPGSLEENVVWTAFEDSQNNFWVGTSGDGLHLMNRAQGTFTHLYYDPLNPQNLSAPHSDFPLVGGFEKVGIRRIYEDREGYIWFVSFDNGLVVYHPVTKKVFRYQNASDQTEVKQNVVPSQSIWNITQSSDGSIWLAGGRPGKVLQAKPVYRSFQHVDLTELVTSHELSAVMEDRKGNIWIGAYGFGLIRYNRKTKQISRFVNEPDNPNTISGNFIWSIYEDKMGYIWIGTFNAGLNRYDPKRHSFKRFTFDEQDSTSISDIYIGAITEDASGNLWVGAKENGLNLYDPVSETFKRFAPGTANPISGPSVENFFVDSQDRFWLLGGKDKLNLSTLKGSGFIDLWDPQKQVFVPYFSGKKKEILGKAATIMVEDSKGSLWFASHDGGLHQFDPGNKSIKYYNPQKGNFPEWDIRWLITSYDSTFWIGSSQYVYNFNPQTSEYTRYDFFAKQPGGNILNNVAYNESGELIFNWGSGFYIFQPEQFKEVAKFQSIPKLLFSNIEISSSDTGRVIHQSLYEKQKIELAYNQNTFNIGIRNFHFIQPQSNRVEYRLVPYHHNWRILQENQLAEYLAVPPGSYSLRAKGFSSEGLESEEKTIAIIIHPPWWQTWWAYSLYTLVGVLLITGMYFFQRRRWQLQTQLQLEQEKAHRLSELDNFKSRFYTNITHEFRTPLTVIKGMTDQIVGNEKIKKLIQRNSSRLLNMVNQLLDLSKLENNNLTLEWVQADVIAYLQYLTESFHSYASGKNLNLAFFSNEADLVMDHDPEKLQQILSNLLSNAIKFTPEFGSVKVIVSRISESGNDYIQLTVKDTGRGIPKDQLSHIFDRFYQVDDSATRKGEGSGIGLALVKELVQLMEGSIEVESEIGKGSSFQVELPIYNNAPKATTSQSALSDPIIDVPIDNAETGLPVNTTNGEKPLILVIEDNADVVEYIFSCLQQDYELQAARNGKEGVEKALEIIPDVILCDVMMPEMDGFEVCQRLKSDQPTSHIPIVLLTAKATQEDKVTGLSHGADAYLTKPFDKKELLVRLKNLAVLSQRLQERLSDPVHLPIGINKTEAKEAAFLKELNGIIALNMEDEQFNTHYLCRTIAMSRTQLHRKLKALTNQSTAHYIRSFRLRRAKTLLETTDLSIGDIGLQVGFKDFSHFSRSFFKEFGMQPSKVRN